MRALWAAGTLTQLPGGAGLCRPDDLASHGSWGGLCGSLSPLVATWAIPPAVALTLSPLSAHGLLVTSADAQAAHRGRQPRFAPLWGRHTSGFSGGRPGLNPFPNPRNHVWTLIHGWVQPWVATAPLTEWGSWAYPETVWSAPQGCLLVLTPSSGPEDTRGPMVLTGGGGARCSLQNKTKQNKIK